MGRPKQNRSVLQARVDPNTISKLKQMALELGYQWGDDGNTGALLDELANIPPHKIKSLLNMIGMSKKLEG